MIIDSRYKVLKELGTGIWATVYKVKDLRTDKIFVLKLFHMLDSDSLYEKFSAENMHHITRLHHLNLIHVTDFGNFGKHIYYLSEYFEGKTLTGFKYKKSTQELLYDIIVQICYALNALHSQNIIHRDLKPNNVIYKIKDNKPVLKLMDYGFTKVDIERTNQRIGNVLPFIAPEIYLGNKAVLQSDFYSLGAILYKITTGSLPFTVEQISALMAGDRFNLFPKFPRELNPEISDKLEKLILKLLERNPEDRFDSAADIISYINQIQPKKYLFSQRWSAVNNIKFSDYLVREDYAHQLLDYVPIISRGNGKIISLTAGSGLGKGNVLTLFRYHLLTDKYYIFDYTCGPKHKDPFYALIKEFSHAAKSNKKLASDLSRISRKLQEYIFESEESAMELAQDEKELDLDFQSALNFIFHLSEVKPLIYIIRWGEYLDKEVFDFLNYISGEITSKPILIILSLINPRKLEGLMHSVQINIEALSFEQSKRYISRLLMETPPDEFIETIWKRSNGNPLFIEQILIDLTNKKKIWDSNKFNFDCDLNNYILPGGVQKSIIQRLDFLSKKNYKYFQKLAFIRTPLSNNLIKFILNIDEKELFFLLKDGFNTELLVKQNEYYYMTFKESKGKFNSETSDIIKNNISKKILQYFQNKRVTQIPVLQGIIKHAEFVKDVSAVRKYRLLQVALFAEKGQQEEAFDEVCKIVVLDFSKKAKIKEIELRSDLQLLLQKSEWATNSRIPDNLRKYILKMPNISEKHIIMGIFYFVMEKFQLANKRFETAYKLSHTRQQRIYILLQLCRTSLFRNKLTEMKKSIDKLEGLKLTDEDKILFIAYKGIHIGSTGRLDEGISLMEEFLPTIKTKNDPNYFIKFGTLHNYLAFLYNKKRMLDEAYKNYDIARKVWEKIDYKRKLATVYNNIGDVALTKGDTNQAFNYFRKANNICSQIGCKRVQVLGKLNQGIAYIKLGFFNIAEKYLADALKLTKKLETNPFYDSIINNLAIAKSKVNNFNYYLEFIKEQVPNLINDNIYKVTPLTKTYFYYLYEIGDYEKIERLLKRFESILFEHKEHEFFYQMTGFVMMANNMYPLALENIEKAFQYSKQNKSDYAQVITFIRFIEYYLGISDIDKAYETCKKAEILCKKHNFRYWETLLDLRKIKIRLLDENVNLRILLRKLFNMIKYVQGNHLFLLEIEVYELLIQIYASLNVKTKAQLFFKRYKDRLLKSTEGLPEHDKELFLRKRRYFLNNYIGLKTVKIEPRFTRDFHKWQDELYDLLKLQEIDRIKFFIDKTINKLLSPHFFAIVLLEEIENKSTPFLKFNIDLEQLYSTKIVDNIRLCLDENTVFSRKIDNNHLLFVPLRIKTSAVGCLIIADNGELSFQDSEKEIAQILKLHLTSILMRINEFATLNEDMILMTKLIDITRKFFTILSLDKLEQEIVTFTLDFTGGSRGFLIKKDKYENYVYKVALDDSKHLLKSYAYISKSILSEVQRTKQPLYLCNTLEDNTEDGSFDLNVAGLSVYCAPLMSDNSIYGYLYIDNYNNADNLIMINPEFMKLLLTQIDIAIKNAQQYESLVEKNSEISSLDNLKKDFINIVSHELKTPLVSLEGNINRIRKSNLSKSDKETFGKIGQSVNKLHLAITDIFNFNKYQMLKKLDKEPVNLKSLLSALKEEAEKISADRHMIFKLEVERKLKQPNLNWDAFYLLLYSLVLNAIRFTKDFGTIIIGARHSTFQQEEINGKESIVVYIQDNGIGIPENQLQKIFQKFYELGDIITHKSGSIEFKSSGLGLGLSTAKLITELHQGKIWINSKENEGTTLFVAIPY